MKCLVVCSLFAAVIFSPAAVFAHGVDVSDVTGQTDVRTVKFGYTDGEPMLFAKVKVYSPSRPDVTVQETIADRDGYFNFIPFEDGDWRLTAEDGMGHKGEIVVTVAGGAGQGAAGTPESVSRPPLVINIALGLSLLANTFGVWYLVGMKRRKAAEAGDAHK